MTLAPLSTERLELRPLAAAALAALRRGDRVALAGELDVHFGERVAPSLRLADALPFMEQRLRGHPDELGWWCWLVLRRDDRKAVGAVGFAGRPDADGALAIGYATYPEALGRGYATEAVRALLGWARVQPGVRRVTAAVPRWNASSRRVAEKVGLACTGLRWEEALGEEVECWSSELS